LCGSDFQKLNNYGYIIYFVFNLKEFNLKIQSDGEKLVGKNKETQKKKTKQNKKIKNKINIMLRFYGALPV